MRQVTQVALVLLISVLALWSCNKDDDGGETTEPQENVEQREPINVYEAAELTPQERLERNLRGLYDRNLAYFLEERTGASGDATHMLPDSAPLTPATIPCGEAAEINPDDWNHPTWQRLRFPPSDDPLHYSYEFISQGTGEGATFAINAYGDLDCDGVISTFTRSGTGRRGGTIEGTMESVITNGEE